MKKLLVSFLSLGCSLALLLSPMAAASGYDDNFGGIDDPFWEYDHICTYSASGNTITQYCQTCDEFKTAVLTLDETISTVYCGSEIKPVKLACDFDNLPPSEKDIVYSNNVDAGTATASLTYQGVTATISFDIKNAPQNAPTDFSTVAETINGKKDGKILGLTTDMEISTDGSIYNAVTDTGASFAAGVYYIRYSAKTNYDPSPATSVTVGAGRKLTITFKADGAEDVVKEVGFGETLTDIPEVPSKQGFTETAPTWDITDFSNIQTDITVNAIYRFTVTFVKKNGEIIGKIASSTSISENDLKENGIIAPSIFGYDFNGWSENLAVLSSDMTVFATYKRAESESLKLTITLKSDGEIVKTTEAVFDQAMMATAKKSLEDGRVFSHWENEVGDVLSLSTEYKFYAPSSITLSAVYTDATSVATAVSPIVINENPLYSFGNNKFNVAFTAKSEAPSGANILSKGLAIGGVNYNENLSSIAVENCDLLAPSTSLDSKHFMITVEGIKQYKTRNARAYIVYELDGVKYTEYSTSVIKIVTSDDYITVSTHIAEN